jgi:hypothetical protein
VCPLFTHPQLFLKYLDGVKRNGDFLMGNFIRRFRRSTQIESESAEICVICGQKLEVTGKPTARGAGANQGVTGTLNVQRSTLNVQRSTLNAQRSSYRQANRAASPRTNEGVTLPTDVTDQHRLNQNVRKSAQSAGKNVKL